MEEYMNILIIGGVGTFVNNLILKLNKEGHRVSVLSGNRYPKEKYQKVFEQYNFTYDSTCISEIFDSVAPEVTIFTGAYDSNFSWVNAESDSVRYTASLANILMGFAMHPGGRLIYLSSEEVYGDTYDENIDESVPVSPDGFKAMALSQGEVSCNNFRRTLERDITVVRFDHLYGIPGKRNEVYDLCSRMCLDALERKSVTYRRDTVISMLFENDAVEFLYSIIADKPGLEDGVEYSTKRPNIYHVSSGVEISEEQLAHLVVSNMGKDIEMTVESNSTPSRRVLSNERFLHDYKASYFCDIRDIVKKISARMVKKSYVFMTGEDVKLPLLVRLRQKAGWFFRAVFPFIENLLVFALIFWFDYNAIASEYVGKLDLYLLYVLLFAIIHGQQQATFSALLSVAGYVYSQLQTRTGFELMIDGNTYVWIAQLFIVGLSVGYMCDQINKLRQETEEEIDYLSLQLSDIKDINNSNVRVKDALETQVINHTDSVGKIFSITSKLDQYSPEEVLFYAAGMVGELIKSKDVAIYLVSNSDYARLFSSTSKKARSLGNSIRYREMGEMYAMLKDQKVFVNKKMNAHYPMMANAIFEEEKMQMIIMVWGLSWENMTLGQSNQLLIVSALIQNAVLRANRYMAAVESKRHVEGTSMLEASSFSDMMKAFMTASKNGLTECTVLKVATGDMNLQDICAKIGKSLRQSDYFGVIQEGYVHILLSNTGSADAMYVINRFRNMDFDCEIAG